jgi:ribosomal-protein-alanine N-acetyltransferase
VVGVHTARLVLAPPTRGDASQIFERYAGDPDVTRYLSWPTHRSVADTDAFIEFSEHEWSLGPCGPLLIRLRDDGRLIGGTGLSCDRADPDEAMTGYVLAKDAWGSGYATEVCTAMVDLARDLGFRRVVALCHAAHRSSWRVLEKCGFVRDPRWTERMVFPNLAPSVLQDVVRYECTMKGRHGDGS